MPTYTLPPLLTDRVDAVNSLLQSIGEAPVSSVELSEAVDVSAADNALTEVGRQLLGEGWHWNREYSLPLARNAVNEILLPNNCLSVMCAYWEGNPGNPAPLVERGRKVYDLENHTFIHTQDAIVDMKLMLEWEEMPELARQYITARGAQVFQGRIQSNRIVMAVEQDLVLSARSTLEQDEDQASPSNQITGNRQQALRVYGRLLRRRM